MRRRAAAIALAVALAAAGAGCGERREVRTGERTMDLAMARAFKRNHDAAIRMAAGRPDRGLVRGVRAHCRPRGRQPAQEATPWPWHCRVRWRLRHDPRLDDATYGVEVNVYGCFEARSGDFPPRLFERVLRRRSANPLVHIRSCP